MARALRALNKISIMGDETAPSVCYCDYQIVDGDLSERPAAHEDGSPNFNQQTDTMCAAVNTAVKTAEGI